MTSKYFESGEEPRRLYYNAARTGRYPWPKEHLIRLNETLSRNQVYAEDEDFAFVASYIKARCRNAKVKI